MKGTNGKTESDSNKEEDEEGLPSYTREQETKTKVILKRICF